MTTIYGLDGRRVGGLEDFWTVVGEAVHGTGGYFGRNLDSLHDCLRGGFGTPDDGDFAIEWRDHEAARRALGHPETVRYLEGVLTRCHPTNRERVADELARARAGRGPTLFRLPDGDLRGAGPGALRLR
ncbi:barstar family protein [Streptomyces sp. R33]|uniref:Barstar family protein n=1 Tax=Streptomyces sp. R33 TaxID=3238629 RepID=A0AB39Y9V4_9ACTN